MNHDETTYTKANSFIPERWLTKGRAIQSYDQYAFPIFQGGPRICIGKDLAIYETKTLLVELIQRYRFEAVDEEFKNLSDNNEWKKDVSLVDGRPVYVSRVDSRNAAPFNLRMYRR